MEKIGAYILLFAALAYARLFGFSAVRFPDSFAKQGALPSIAEWRKSRASSTNVGFVQHKSLIVNQ